MTSKRATAHLADFGGTRSRARDHDCRSGERFAQGLLHSARPRSADAEPPLRRPRGDGRLPVSRRRRGVHARRVEGELRSRRKACPSIWTSTSSESSRGAATRPPCSSIAGGGLRAAREAVFPRRRGRRAPAHAHDVRRRRGSPTRGRRRVRRGRAHGASSRRGRARCGADARISSRQGMRGASLPERSGSVHSRAMAAPRALTNLGPRRLVEEALTLDLIAFLARHGDAHLLLVRIPEGDTELELGLSAGAASAGRWTGTAPLSHRASGPPARVALGVREGASRRSGGVVAARREASALRRGRAQTGRLGRPLHGPHLDWTRAQ